MLTAEHGAHRGARVAPARGGGSAEPRTRQKRDLEFAWGTFLARGMEQGLLPERDPQLLTRAVIGLYNSVWVWYRPGGSLELADVGRFFVDRQLEVLGCEPDTAARWLAAA